MTGGEFDLIGWIRERARATDAVTIGIGDDAAGLRTGPETLLATDTLLEGTHFDRATATAREIGRKAMAVNLSDLAAMAARPTAVVVGLSLTRGSGIEFARELMGGIVTLAEAHGAAVVGGDVTTWDGPVAVTVTVLGEPTGHGPVRRSGARPGDRVLVTGELGGSLASGRHFWFQPRLDEAVRLHETVQVNAMIDVSDGLAADLGHVLDESRVGAILDAGRIPITETAGRDDSPIDRALGDGEDFELLFTTPPEDAERLLENPPFETRLTIVGEITESPGLLLRDEDGRQRPLDRKGWRHEL